MDVRTVIWTETALKQRNSIFKYWNIRNGNKNYSRKLNRLINDRIEQIITNPTIGKQSEITSYRIIPMSNYSLIYKVNEVSIFIIAFWNNRQNRKKLLDILTRS